MNQTQRDYYDALALAAPRLGTTELRRLAAQVTVIAEPNRRFTYGAVPQFKGSPYMDRRRIIWRVGSDVASLKYRVERIELMTTLIVSSSTWLYTLPMEERQGVCRHLGCDYSLIVNPRLRWLHIFQRLDPADAHPMLEVDDRPICRICRHLHVSSGHAQTDRHDNCQEFLHSVLLPALTAQRAALGKLAPVRT